MSENGDILIFCKWCGEQTNQRSEDPCPKCGKVGRSISKHLGDVINISDSFNWVRRREYFQENPKIKWLLILIGVLSPFLGLIFSGIPGVIVGLIISAISYILGPYAITKVIEIMKGGNS